MREYSVWNAAAATLQFWTADLEPNILSSAIEWVYAPSFYTTSMHLLCNQPEELLFSCFVTMLNDAFEREHALADEGYESGNENSNLSTPLRRTSRIHHISSNENISFDPSAPCTTATSQSKHKPVCTAIYPLAVLTMKTFLQFIVHLIPASYYHWIPWVLQSHQPRSSLPHVLTLKKKIKKIFKQLQ